MGFQKRASNDFHYSIDYYELIQFFPIPEARIFAQEERLTQFSMRQPVREKGKTKERTRKGHVFCVEREKGHVKSWEGYDMIRAWKIWIFL